MLGAGLNDTESRHRPIQLPPGRSLESAGSAKVGGGDREKNISANIVQALQLAQRVGARIVGVVGRDSGYSAKVADAVVIIPTISADTATLHTEAFQAVVWHLVASHPALKRHEMKWESVV
jgi:D-sedoheptulose 7-phosphate isomerase